MKRSGQISGADAFGDSLLRWLAAIVLLLTAPCHTLVAQTLVPAPEPRKLLETGVLDYKILSPEALGLDTAPVGLHVMADGRLMAYDVQQISIGDGIRWEAYRLTPAPNPPTLVDLMTGDDGETYGLCSLDTNAITRIAIDTHGNLEFADQQPVSTLNQLQHPAFSERRRTGWTPKDGPLPRVELLSMLRNFKPANLVERVFALKGKVYATDRANGHLYVIEGDHFTQTQGNILNSGDHAISGIATYDEGRLLLSTHGKGLMIFDGTQLTPFPLPEVLIKNRRLGDLCQTAGGFFALAIENYGIVFFNHEGVLVNILNKGHDHSFSNVRQLLRGPGASLWAVLNTGIAYIAFPSPITHMHPIADKGFQFALPVRHEGHLWLCTDGSALRGVYDQLKHLESFVPDTPPNNYVLSLHSFAEQKLLLAGTDKGLFVRRPGQWVHEIAGINAMRLVAPSADGQRFFYVARNEVGWVALKGGQLQAQRFPQTKLNDCYGSVMDKDGVAWLELGAGRCARVDFREASPVAENFGPEQGLPEGWVQLFLLQGRAVSMSSGQSLSYNAEEHRFMPDPFISTQLPQRMHGRMAVDAKGHLWTSTNQGVRAYDISGPTPLLLPEGRIDGYRPFYIVPQADGIIWMHRSNTLLRYDPSMADFSTPVLRALITKVQLSADNLNIIPKDGAIAPIAYASNSLAFTFYAPGAPLNTPVSFDTRLEGSDKDWLPAGNTGRAVFPRLKEGRYVLHVRPRAGDTLGTEASVSFEIKPPWFRTTGAYIALALSLIAGTASVAWTASYLTRREKWRLAHVVAERTRELHQTNARLSQQITETETKANALRQSEESLRRLNEELEQRVEARTQALNTLNEHLNSTNKRLNESNNELEAFSYSVSHDLRAPLRNIGGFAELLTKRVHGQLDDTGNHYLKIISTESSRLSLLIDSLLRFSRVQRAEMKLESCNLNEIIAEIREEQSHTLRDRRVEWRIETLPTITGDPTLLRQVFENLISNALKFTRHREVALIEISCDVSNKALPEGQGSQVIHVKDNGAGFDPRHMSKLFGVFQRLHSTKDFEGTGIGLANVKRIVLRHGGSVWAEGKPGEGAVFHVAFPEQPQAPVV